MPAPRSLRPDLPFRRIALVLSGGGALGAYEVGVLKVLEALKLDPAILAGVSVGAINAVIWEAHAHHTAPLEQTWRRLRGEHVGIHWVTLALRSAGALALAIGLLEALLTITGSREFSGAYWLWRKFSGRVDLWSAQLDIVSWLLIGAVGLGVVLFARRIEQWLARGAVLGEPSRARTMLGRITLGLALVHSVIWLMGWAWPHRFSASLLVLMTLAWLGSGPGRTGTWLRRLAFGLMPETGGRGLWGAGARRNVLEKLVGGGDPTRLVGGPTELIISAMAIDSGRMCHFVSWPHPSEKFLARVRQEVGEVVPLRTPEETLAAVIASSAIPGVFEPARIDDREFVDPGGFSNQPLHVVLANDADAVIVVLLTPSASPGPAPPPGHLIALAGRLLELANWRDLQTELRQLPDGFSREGLPARICVVEPQRPLPGSVLGFDPEQAIQLIGLGEQDAWIALARAGWLADAPPA